MLNKDILRHAAEFRRSLANKQFEKTENGILFTKAKVAFSGVFEAEFMRHPLLTRAMETGDPERVDWTQRMIKALGLQRIERDAYDLLAVDVGPNIVVDEGINDILDAALSGGTPITTRYNGLFSTDVTPDGTWTGANWASGGTPKTTEFTNYDESTRQQWQEGGVSAKSITNSANKSVFTISTGGGTLYGAVLISASAKDQSGDSTATLTAAKRFTDAPRSVAATDVVNLTYTITGSSS